MVVGSLTALRFIEQYQASMRHWVFDFDGTLVDSDGNFWKAMGHALAPFSVNVAENFMEQIRHKHPDRIFEDILSEVEAKEAISRLRLFGKELSETIKPFQGIQDALEVLKSKGVSLSIWTGRDRESTDRILKRTNLLPYFERVVSGTCVGTNKPGHDGLIELLNHYKAQGDEMVMIGDHHHDIEPANELGLTSVHACWKKTPHVLPEQVKPNYSFDCTGEFQNWIVSGN